MRRCGSRSCHWERKGDNPPGATRRAVEHRAPMRVAAHDSMQHDGIRHREGLRVVDEVLHPAFGLLGDPIPGEEAARRLLLPSGR